MSLFFFVTTILELRYIVVAHTAHITYTSHIMDAENLHSDAPHENAEQLPSVSDGALQLASQLFDDSAGVQTREELQNEELKNEELKNYVLENVVALLTKNPERLMSILYRIDVPEQRVRQVMSNEPVGGIARMLTALILERMEQKLETRRKYKEEQKQRGRGRDDDHHEDHHDESNHTL